MIATIVEAKQTKVTICPVFKYWDHPIFALLIGVMLLSECYFLLYWFSHQDWVYYPLSFVMMTGALLLYLFLYQLRWPCLPFMRISQPVMPRPGQRVGVATTFVPGAESIEMLEETLRRLVAMDYPYETWVLDKGNDEQVSALCLQQGAYHFSRKHLPQYHAASGIFASQTKCGNYNAWLYEVAFDRYDIIAAFDPDHVPCGNFLTQLL